jgi:hypothetical protein
MLGTTTKRGGRLDVSRTLAAMPTAALADIHGNLPALEAVLADPRCAAGASGHPNADDAVETLLTPPTPEEATARWEQSRLQ